MVTPNQALRPLEYRGLARSTNIPPCAVSLDDLRRLCGELAEKTREALELHLGTLSQPPDMTPAQFEDLKQQARRVATLSVTINGAYGEQIVAACDDAFNANLPEEINWILFDSAAALRAYNVTPLNRFTLRLDFTEPPGFDSYNPWDQPTPNNSTLEVIGSDHTWVTAVYESALAFFNRRRQRRAWLHTQTTFNILNWLVGFPAALWIIYRLDSAVHGISRMHSVLRGALYVYVFLLALLLFRGMFGACVGCFPLSSSKVLEARWHGSLSAP